MTVTPLKLGLCLSVAALAGCSAPVEQPRPAATATVQSPAPTPPPPVSINAEMVSLVDHAGHALWDVEKQGRAPKTDADWREVEHHATQLAAAGSLLMLGGAGPNDLVWANTPSWKTRAKAMTDAGTAALNATHAKNLDALVKANGQLVDACEGCHKEFKPDLPSEGITHGH